VNREESEFEPRQSICSGAHALNHSGLTLPSRLLSLRICPEKKQSENRGKEEYVEQYKPGHEL
jgi:hypothetical protein